MERMNIRPLGALGDLDDIEANAHLKRFVDDGLLWLVNTTILHPRGYALAVHRDAETKEPLGISLLGDGSEPWYFQPGEFDEIINRYEEAEKRRNLEWFNAEGDGNDAQ